GLISGDGSAILIDDETGVRLETPGDITITAQGPVNMEAAETYIRARRSIYVLSGRGSGFTMTAEGVNLYGAEGIEAAGRERESYDLIEDAPMEDKFNPWLVLGHALGAIAAVGFMSLAVLAVAPAVIAVSAFAFGALAVAAVAAGDLAGRKVSDAETYVKEGVIGSLVGAVTGGAGLGLGLGLGIAARSARGLSGAARIAAASGIGGGAMGAGGAANYGLHWQEGESSLSGMGQAALKGAVFGAVGGPFFAKQLTAMERAGEKLSLEFLSLMGRGFGAGVTGDAAVQGMQLLSGEQSEFDAKEAFHSGMMGVAGAAIFTGVMRPAGALKDYLRPPGNESLPKIEGAEERQAAVHEQETLQGVESREMEPESQVKGITEQVAREEPLAVINEQKMRRVKTKPKKPVGTSNKEIVRVISAIKREDGTVVRVVARADGRKMHEVTTQSGTISIRYNPTQKEIKKYIKDLQEKLESIRKKGFKPKSGDIFEYETGQFLLDSNFPLEAFKQKVINAKTGEPLGDLDIVTKDYIIELKISSKSAEFDQLRKYTDPMYVDYMNYENKKVILYVQQENGFEADVRAMIDNGDVMLVMGQENLLEVLQNGPER
ncbi:MAG: hypothetical protein LBK56_14045, partial [Gracilibacteraceae bacterium]|nr:hypothetical protein [Gracilibacteraceae bacterium]